MTPARRRVVAELADLAAAVRVPHPARVAVDGVDAAGKTTLADELARELERRGREVVRASVDGFHRPAAERYVLGRDSPLGYYRDSFDYDALRRLVLEPLGPGGDRRYRAAAYDSYADSRVDVPERTAAADAILVVDGVFLGRPELAGCWELRIFLELDEAESVRRGAARDAWFLGGEEDARARYERRYAPGQRLYLATGAVESADVVVDAADPASPRILRRPPGPVDSRR